MKLSIEPNEIELASYGSWVAFEQLDYQGWILRFANGETKRNNSVNVISAFDGSLPVGISFCESFFNSRSQPTIFRLLSFVDNLILDRKLADRGYRFADPSLVLYQNIQTASKADTSLDIVDRETWLKTYCDISGISLESQQNHAKILSKIPHSSLFAVLKDKHQPVACVLGVIQRECFGIFNLVTKSELRNQGYATSLIKSAIAWAKNLGIQHFYLQVTAQNTSAINLYEKLGYRYLYHYWYRIQPQ